MRMTFGQGFDSPHLHQPSPRLRLAGQHGLSVEALFFLHRPPKLEE